MHSFGKAIRPLFADPVTNIQFMLANKVLTNDLHGHTLENDRSLIL